MIEIQDILTQIFPQATPETLATLLDNGRVKTYPKDTVLTTQNAIEKTFYVLLDGQVKIRKYTHGNYHMVDVLQRGDCFGELALIFNVPRTADIIVAHDATVLEIDRHAFDEQIKWNPAALHTLMQIIIIRMLKQLDQRLYEVSRKLNDGKPDVFFSYAHEDDAFARTLVQSFKRYNLNVWIDIFNLESGASWARQIGEALDQCKIMVLILSPASMASNNVEDEWNYYLDKGRPILPILYEPCDIPYRLHKLQYVDFTSQSFDDGVLRVIGDVHSILTTVLGEPSLDVSTN
ncbi:MAG: TIR domain-containing protein [Chloroflexota bacterium]